MDTNNPLDLSRKKILVVEDDYICFQLLKEILNETHVTVLHAENSAQAMSLLGKEAPVNLIFMDIQLPDMSGLQASAAIRKRYPDVPIIIQTAFAFESYQKKSQEIGCTDFIVKPLEPEKVLSVVAKYIQ
jgi:CheY-like chemotaxis protein